MNKKTIILFVIGVTVMTLLAITSTYSLYRKLVNTNGRLALATWNVTLNQEGIDNTVTITPVTDDDTYTLNITSTSKVDVEYSIVVSNLPEGVKVALGEEEPKEQDSNHKIVFPNAGNILYNDENKTRTHTLTFSAVANTAAVDSQSVSIDVIVSQMIDN